MRESGASRKGAIHVQVVLLQQALAGRSLLRLDLLLMRSSESASAFSACSTISPACKLPSAVTSEGNSKEGAEIDLTKNKPAHLLINMSPSPLLADIHPETTGSNTPVRRITATFARRCALLQRRIVALPWFTALFFSPFFFSRKWREPRSGRPGRNLPSQGSGAGRNPLEGRVLCHQRQADLHQLRLDSLCPRPPRAVARPHLAPQDAGF